MKETKVVSTTAEISQEISDAMRKFKKKHRISYKDQIELGVTMLHKDYAKKLT